MNSLIIPPSPNWYETSVLICTPDNTLIYGSRSDIVVIEQSHFDAPSNVRIISKAHSQKIVSVHINKNWDRLKLLVTASEDKIIKLWNAESWEKKSAHNEHINYGKLIGANFAGDERIVSVSEEGIIVVWNIHLDETKILKDVFGLKVSVTCISICPHAPWLTAFGLKSGLVIVADLRKNGKVLYKLRGHDKSVLSLAWCPAPINIFPKDPSNYVGVKNLATGSVNCSKSELLNDEKRELTEEINTSASIVEARVDETVEHDKTETSNEDRNEEEISKNINISKDEESVDVNASISVESNIKEFLNKCEDEENVEIVCTSTISKVDVDETKSINSKESMVHDNKDHIENVYSKNEGAVELRCNINNSEKDENDSAGSIEVTNTDRTENMETNQSDESIREKNEHDIETTDMVSRVGEDKSCGDVETVTSKKISQEEVPRKEFLLASSAKESNIYIWRAGTDGRMQTLLTVPNKPNYRKGKLNDKIWITLCWVTPTALLSSSKSAELLQWTLPKPKNKMKLSQLIHNDHTSLLFNIAAPIILSSEFNWREERKLNVWTTGQDRLLLNTSLSSERINLACYPTFGGILQCFAQSPLDPNRLAVGTGDGFVKIWDLSRPHIKNIIMTSFYQKIQSKVTTLAWHPIKELILSYGTFEGRVGYMDSSNNSKMPVLLPHFFKTQIHKVEWGPINENKKYSGLFVVAEGKLVLFDMNKSSKDPIELDKPDNAYIYTFAWKPDYSVLLASTKLGTVLIYSTNLKILSTHYLQQKLQHICWHPEAIGSDIKTSEYCNRFAAVYNNFNNLVVYDFGLEANKTIAKYEGHDELVSCIVWSPFDPNKMVIASEDGVAQIWEMKTNTILATYIDPNFEGLLCVTWSPVDGDYIISGGKDHTLKVWRISDYPPKNKKEISNLRKKIVKQITNETTYLLPKVEKITEPLKVTKSNKTNLLPNFYLLKDTSQTVADLKTLLNWRESINNNASTEVADERENILKIFGSNSDMLDLIKFNETILQKKGKYDLKNMLGLFKGDISTTIKEAIEGKRVNTWIISVAPMVSPQLWLAACETYAQQLTEESDADPLEIVTYYLASHKIEKAIDFLCDSALFREALALAKCRLPENDPTVTKIIEKWANYSVVVGNFEIAAQCKIFLGKYEEAVSVLFKRSDVEILKFAVELAEKSGNEELRKAVHFRYSAFQSEYKDIEKEEKLQPNDKLLNEHNLLEPLKYDHLPKTNDTNTKNENTGGSDKPEEAENINEICTDESN